MKKVLLVTDRLEHYRIPMFNSLCDRINLTIASGNKCENGSNQFAEHKMVVERLGPFIKYRELPDLNVFDVVIVPFNIRCWELWKQLFSRRTFRLFVFGIGVTASYGKNYDQKSVIDIFRTHILKKIDGAIFYEHYPYIKYLGKGINPALMSVAYNTVAPNVSFDFEQKRYESFIFIGTLYKQKKIFDLLNAYLVAYNKANGALQKLEIIGNGEEFNAIQQWIVLNSLEDQVILHGDITDDTLLLPIFNRAIACISPGQAGLSVQKCFSYGVPFVTSEFAITGGESFSIIHGVNGFVYSEDTTHLADILLKFSDDLTNRKLAENAYLFYKHFRNVNIWKEGFLKNII